MLNVELNSQSVIQSSLASFKVPLLAYISVIGEALHMEQLAKL